MPTISSSRFPESVVGRSAWLGHGKPAIDWRRGIGDPRGAGLESGHSP